MTGLNYIYNDFSSYRPFFFFLIHFHVNWHMLSQSLKKYFLLLLYSIVLQGLSGCRWFFKECLCHKDKLYLGQVRYSSESD